MQVSPVGRFFWRVFLWLPICFTLWYYFGNLLMLPANFLASSFVTSFFPELVRQMTPHGSFLEVVCAFAPPSVPDNMTAPPGQVAELVLNINVLKYGYSIPLYTALILSSPGEERQKWLRWIFGVGIIYLALAWGVSFEVIKSVVFGIGQGVSSSIQAHYSQWALNAMALAYQFGYLILPAVTPLVLWIAFHRDFLQTLIKKSPEPSPQSPEK